MHVIEMEALIEHELSEAVQRHYPLDWDEDSITHDLMIRLRDRFREVTLHGLQYPLQLEWEAYKLRGKREENHGDIGVLLRHRLPSGAEVEGAGFLEAKLRARDSTRFNQVRHEQVQRILKRSAHTRLLMYDYNAVPVLGADCAEVDVALRPLRRLWRPPALVTHGPVVPLELAAAINQYDDGLYRFAHALSFQIARRFFMLHDVDFTHAAVETVKGFPPTLVRRGDDDGHPPNYVMVVRAAALGQSLPEPFAPNANLYRGISGEGSA
jgi:hypothetical protein